MLPTNRQRGAKRPASEIDQQDEEGIEPPPPNATAFPSSSILTPSTSAGQAPQAVVTETLATSTPPDVTQGDFFSFFNFTMREL